MRRNIASLALLTVALFALVACEDDAGRPYLSFAGGGFIFNYRIGEAHYGFVLRPERRLPEGAVIEAELENPAGGPPFRSSLPVKSGQLQYVFQSPPVKGIQANREYTVTVRLYDPQSGADYARYGNVYRTNVDQASLPDKPLVVGPGYAKNPEVDYRDIIPDNPRR